MRGDQNPPATRALSPARRADGARIRAFLSFSDPTFHAGGTVPSLARKRDIISLGFARLFFRDGHVQRGRNMDLRQPA